MKTYTLSFAAGIAHTPIHPERTAYRNGTGMNFDRFYQVWSNRPSLARTVRMQERRERRSTDWIPCVKLTPGEGY